MKDLIMIVDDDATNIKLAGMTLSKAGYPAAGVKSGRALIDYVKKKGQPGLVLLDILMPEMDGFETYEALRALEKELSLSPVPVLFASAEETPETAKRCTDLGASGFVKKPYTPDALIQAVGTTLA